MPRPTVKISLTKIHWFRLSRSGLVKPFSTPEETATRLIGVQAQLPPAAELAFRNRTANCTRSGLQSARLERRSLVRFWGQRNTLHLFHAADWPWLHAAFQDRQSMVYRRLEKAGLLGEFKRVVTRASKRLAKGDVLTYGDIKSKKLETEQDRWVVSYLIFMELVRQGLVCHGPEQTEKLGARSSFVHRAHWRPDLEWDPPPVRDAMAEVACRYLTTYGPAEVRDLAFWYGGTVSQAKQWIAAAGDRCCSLKVEDREFWCCRSDLAELSIKPPAPSRWPVRLLYRFDPLVLATKDKTWLIDESDYKKVWRGSAHVEAVLLVRGRIAGTWRYDKKAKGLEVRVTPFAPLSATVNRAAEKEAAATAEFFGLDLAKWEVSPG